MTCAVEVRSGQPSPETATHDPISGVVEGSECSNWALISVCPVGKANTICYISFGQLPLSNPLHLGRFNFEKEVTRSGTCCVSFQISVSSGQGQHGHQGRLLSAYNIEWPQHTSNPFHFWVFFQPNLVGSGHIPSCSFISDGLYDLRGRDCLFSPTPISRFSFLCFVGLCSQRHKFWFAHDGTVPIVCASDQETGFMYILNQILWQQDYIAYVRGLDILGPDSQHDLNWYLMFEFYVFQYVHIDICVGFGALVPLDNVAEPVMFRSQGQVEATAGPNSVISNCVI